MGLTSIEWTDRTWNPVRGCSRVSQGCVNCYAEKMAARFSDEGHTFEGFAIRTPSGPRWTGKVELIESKLTEPLHWKKPQRVFVNSMSDLFHEALPDDAIDRVFAVMALCPHITFQILTKRPERMLKYFIIDAAERVERILNHDYGCTMWTFKPKGDWPLPNVWLGVSVEDQETADARIPLLLQTPAAIRFVSYEPALGPVDFRKFLPRRMSLDEIPGSALNDGCTDMWTIGLDWIIAGGESGPGARPPHPDWFRQVKEQCRAASVPFFMKQLIERGRKLAFDDFPEDLRIREFPITIGPLKQTKA